jgi:two-component system sensor histidine kinase KdpD
MVGERAKKTKKELVGLLTGTLGIGVATAILKFFEFEQYLYNVALVFILVVLLIASRFGLWPGIAISILGFLSLNYFFITPFGTLYIDSAAGVVAVVSFLVAAIITSEIAARARRNTEQAKLGQQETSALNQVNVAVLGEAQPAPMLQQVVRQVTQNSEAGFAAIYTATPDQSDQLALNASYPEAPAAGPHPSFSAALVDSSFKQKEPLYSRLVGQGRTAYLPLLRGGQALGVLFVFVKETAAKSKPSAEKEKEVFEPQERRWFQILANQAALAVDHANLIAENALVASLKETDRLKSMLLGLVSHELRTPITAIKTAVAGLKDAGTDLEPDELNEYLEIIDQESNRLSRLISNLLDLSRIEAGRLVPQKGLYFLPEIVGQTVDRLTRSNTLANHPVKTCFEDDLPLVPLDYLQIEQVVTNLLENAVKYSPESQPISIEVCQASRFVTIPARPGEAEKTERVPGVMVEIADRGSGIPEAELGHIFEKFYRVAPGREARLTTPVPGSGLGLAICKGIIEAHSGQIWAENRQEGGSVFSFWLPLKSGQ